jgi:NAD(P)H-dependent flavin oxidoreductase YrpB (nitropropane dioxygenase family)
VDLRDRLGLDIPLVQAGMGGGAARGELAGAVSAAGALGTVGIMAPRPFASALRSARVLAPGRPVAANLLVPFARRAHVQACVAESVALVVFHGGLGRRWFGELRDAGIPILCTVGSAAQARAAMSAGADGLVAQGVEAGGHLAGTQPLDTLLPAVIEAAGGAPVLAAGGVADADDVRRLLGVGAAAAVAGTRFLLTDESAVHPEYQRRVVGADRTLRTQLFGLGWPMPHRVVPNAATDRWCARSEQGPGLVRAANRIGAPLARVVPLGRLDDLATLQRRGVPLFSPALPLARMPAESVDRCALYAGESARRITDIVPAAEAVARLTP